MKIRKLIIISLIILIICSTFISCTKKDEDSDRASENMYRITCIIPHKDDKAYWSVIEEGVIDGARDNNVNVKIVYPSLNYDTTQMLKLLKMAIASKVDCIILSGVEDKAYYLTIQKAIASGIFVVLVDTDMTDLDNVIYVGSNNVDAGVLFANNIAKIKNESANIGIISGKSEFYNLRKRLEGIKTVVDNYPNMNIVDIKYDKFDYSIVQQIYDDYINNPNIDTIVCLEGTGGMALNLYLEAIPNVDIFVFDDTPQALEGLRNNYFSGIIVQQKYLMGYKVIEEIVAFRDGCKFVPKKIYTDTSFIEDESVNY